MFDKSEFETTTTTTRTQDRRVKFFFLHVSRCTPINRPWGVSSGSSFIFLQISFLQRS